LSLKTRISELGPRTEFAIVAGLAFGLFAFASVRHLFLEYGQARITTDRLTHLIVYEVPTFVALVWFLRQRDWTAERVGAIPSLSDVPVGIALSIGCYVVNFALWLLVALLAPGAVKPASDLLPIAGRYDLLMVLAVSFVNPVFEETFLCGYVVTALAPVCRPATAVSISVGIRTLYHLYLGPRVVAIVPVGLLFTWYYARTRRLWPLIVAHAILDFAGLVRYT
jgi:membrane protease YdiL (CAAX protease family)